MLSTPLPSSLGSRPRAHPSAERSLARYCRHSWMTRAGRRAERRPYHLSERSSVGWMRWQGLPPTSDLLQPVACIAKIDSQRQKCSSEQCFPDFLRMLPEATNTLPGQPLLGNSYLLSASRSEVALRDALDIYERCRAKHTNFSFTIVFCHAAS